MGLLCAGKGQVTLHTEDDRVDKVDYSFSDGDRVLQLVQVKASFDPESADALFPGDILEVFFAQIRADADEYVLQTNRRLSPGATAVAQVLAGSSRNKLSPASPVDRLLKCLFGARHAEALRGLDDVHVERLRRCRVFSDERTTVQVYD